MTTTETKQAPSRDEFIIQHLKAWVDKQFPRNGDATFLNMINYLGKLDDADFFRALEIGWWNVYDEMNA